jgi:hypothetical protein
MAHVSQIKIAYVLALAMSLIVVGGCLGSTARAPSPTVTTTVTAQSAAQPAGPRVTAALATPAPAAGPAVPASLNKFGVHLLLDDGAHPWPVEIWPKHLEFARQGVGDWGYVVQLVRSDNMDVKHWQTFMTLCAQDHLTPIIRLATIYNLDTNSWQAPTQDPDGSYRGVASQYAQFVAALQWPTSTHYVVVGNEPNHGDEWSNHPDPAAYARYLVDVADAIHNADPNAKVMNAGFDSYAPNTNGAPAPNGYAYIDEESFIDGMIAAQPDVFSHIDLWASHSYPRGPFASAPWDQVFQIDLTNGATNPHHVEPPPGIFNRGINGYTWELFKLSTYGVKPLPVIITETGWLHVESVDENSGDDSDANKSKAKDVAASLRYAFVGNTTPVLNVPTTGWTPWLSDPRIVGVCLFALDGYPGAWGHTNLLMMGRAGEIKGTYAHFDELARLSSGQ